jgi:hypothetical protein
MQIVLLLLTQCVWCDHSPPHRCSHGLDTTIDVIPHHGSTDPLIVIKVLEHHGINHDTIMQSLPGVQTAMNQHFLAHAAERAGEGLEMLPGVEHLLMALKVSWSLCLRNGHGAAPTGLDVDDEVG